MRYSSSSVMIACAGLPISGSSAAWMTPTGARFAQSAAKRACGALVASMLVLMTLGALAGEGHSWRELRIFFPVMLLMGVGIFIWGLGMPIKVFPWN